MSESREFVVPQAPPGSFLGNRISTCKYNALSFLPKNLWYQFQKIANVYFLVIAVMQVIPEISVSGGIPSILLPLTFVLSLSAVKDLLEDLKRKRSDKEENNKTTTVWRGAQWAEIAWENAIVGDTVKVRNNEGFCADIVFLASSDEKGLCYIETKNLDGETNLKHKLANKHTQEMLGEGAGGAFAATVETEAPNAHIYRFRGVLKFDELTVPLGSAEFLLRGSSLKNTDWVIGVAVYTGHETKIMLNSSASRSKFSSLESQINTQIIYIFLMQIVICLFCALFYTIWFNSNEDDTNEYLDADGETDSLVLVFTLIFFSWMLIFTQFVPISLIVTLELVKFIQAIFIAWDLNLYHEVTDSPAGVTSSNLNEDLGQIHYVFSDKTGTVTQNVMEFRKLSVNGVSYGTDARMQAAAKTAHIDFVDSSLDPRSQDITEFMTVLALCHTIITEELPDGSIEFKASSPDELALVSAAKYFGVELLGRDKDQKVLLQVHGSQLSFAVLQVLEFTSKRGRMSVVVQYPDGAIWVLSKGADSKLLPRLLDSPFKNESWAHLEEYAADGLRTLIVARRELSAEEYHSWASAYEQALSTLTERDRQTTELSEQLETSLQLIGVTAVEDKLQEGVPEAIANIRGSGIKVWLITGDKMETAVNIGFSCSLLTNQMGRAVVDGITSNMVQYQLQEAILAFKTEPFAKFALIVSGDALLRITSTNLKHSFVSAMKKADVVIACRVSPQQKAEIVRLVKENRPQARTLAIGDGANDVNMITVAHVGVGIAGLEGAQAVRASDFAVAQFAHLQRLLFVHGRECYRRNSTLVCYNFYKNSLFVMPLFYYGILSAFSAQIMYNIWTYQLFNVIFASLPIVLYAVFDRDIDYERLMRTPELYKLGFSGSLFSTKVFWLWIGESMLQAFFVCFASVYAVGRVTGDESTGKLGSMWVVSDLVYGIVVVISNLKVLEFTVLHYWFTVSGIVLSIGSYFVTSYSITSVFPIKETLDNFDGRGSTAQVLENPNSYTCILLVTVGCLMMLPVANTVVQMVNSLKLKPRPEEDQFRGFIEEEEAGLLSEKEELPLSTYTPMRYRKHTGFAFSGEPGHAPQITDPHFRSSFSM